MNDQNAGAVPQPPATTQGGPSAGQNAGRGLAWIASAKLYFILSGYAVPLLLPRLLGGPEAFGLFSLALSQISILNNVMIAATVQTVSRHVSRDLQHARVTLRQALWLQLGLGGTLALAVVAAAPWFSQSVLLDAAVGPLLRVLAVSVFCYSLYAALVGTVNGRQQFQLQARLDMTYTTLRVIGILGAAALGFGAQGATAGLATAASTVLLVAFVAVGAGERGLTTAWKAWLAFMAPLWLYQLFVNLALQVDLSVLKASAAALSVDAGMDPDAASAAASRMVGFYRAAQTIAFVPYQLILSVTFVVFPMVSQAQSSGDSAASRRYVQNALRFSLLVLLAIAAPVSGAPAGVMRLAYPAEYLAGADALCLLAPGVVCFALFVIGATMLSGAGRPQLAAALALLTVALVTGCNYAAIHAVALGPRTLAAAAMGSSLGMACGAVAMAVAIHACFGTLIAWRSAVRSLLAATVAWWIAHVLPSHTHMLALCALIAGGSGFIATLFVSGELRLQDVGRLRTLRRAARSTPQEK